MSDELATENFLNNCHFMTISVISDGAPWAVPVHISKRQGFVFEWESNSSAVHSQAVVDHPQVALTMFQLTDDHVKEFGFYAIAEAERVSDLPDGRATYRATVKKAWINDEQHQKREIIV